MWLRNDEFLHIVSFTPVGVVSEIRPKLSSKSLIFEKIFEASANVMMFNLKCLSILDTNQRIQKL